MNFPFIEIIADSTAKRVMFRIKGDPNTYVLTAPQAVTLADALLEMSVIADEEAVRNTIQEIVTK